MLLQEEQMQVLRSGSWPSYILLPESQFHICFCIFASVAPSILFLGRSLAGIFQALSVIGYSATIGIFYFLGFILFVLEGLLSIWVMQRVYRYFRGSGKEAEMRPDAASRRPSF
uniref:Secretory carrier-associated membrane protein n=1 Tax=Aegilops tauschii TaxID=37682 RepID=M8CTR5_AEGTA